MNRIFNLLFVISGHAIQNMRLPESIFEDALRISHQQQANFTNYAKKEFNNTSRASGVQRAPRKE